MSDLTQDDEWDLFGHPDSELPINDLDESLEDNEFLNDVDKGVVGIDKPRIVRIFVPDYTATRFEDSDNDAADPLEADWDDIDA